MKIKLISITLLIMILCCYEATKIYAQPLNVAAPQTITTTQSYTTGTISDVLTIKVPSGTVTFSGEVNIHDGGQIIVEEGALIIEDKTIIDSGGYLIVDSGRIRLGNVATDSIIINGTMQIYANPTNAVDSIMGRIFINSGGELITGNDAELDSVIVWNPFGLNIAQQTVTGSNDTLDAGKFILQGRAVWFKGATGDLLDWSNPDNVTNKGNITIKNNAIFFIGTMPETTHCDYSSVIGSDILKTGFLNINGTIEVQDDAMLWFGYNSELRSGYEIADTAYILLSGDAVVKSTTSINQSPWNDDPAYSANDTIPVNIIFVNAVTGDETDNAVSIVEMTGDSKLLFHNIINSASIISGDTALAKNEYSGYGIINLKDNASISVTDQLINAHSEASEAEINIENNAKIEAADVINANILNAIGLIILKDSASFIIANTREFGGGLTNGNFGKGKIELNNFAIIEVSEGTGGNYGAIIQSRNIKSTPLTDSILLYDSSKIIANVTIHNPYIVDANALIELADSSEIVANKNVLNGVANGSEGTINILGGTFIMKGDTLINGISGATGNGIINIGGSPPNKGRMFINKNDGFTSYAHNYADSNKVYLILHDSIYTYSHTGLFIVNQGEYVVKSGQAGFDYDFGQSLLFNTYALHLLEYGDSPLIADHPIWDSNIAHFALLSNAIFDITEGIFMTNVSTAAEGAYYDASPSTPSTVIYSGMNLNVSRALAESPYGRIVVFPDATFDGVLGVAGEVPNAFILSPRTHGIRDSLVIANTPNAIVFFVRNTANAFYGDFDPLNPTSLSSPADSIELIGMIVRYESHSTYPSISGVATEVDSVYVLFNNHTKVSFSSYDYGDVYFMIDRNSPTNVSDASTPDKYAERKFYIAYRPAAPGNSAVISNFQASFWEDEDINYNFLSKGAVFYAKGCNPAAPATELGVNGATMLTSSSPYIFSIEEPIVCTSTNTCNDNFSIHSDFSSSVFDEILLMAKGCVIGPTEPYYFYSVATRHNAYVEINPSEFINFTPSSANYSIEILLPPTKGTETVMYNASGRNVIVYVPTRSLSVIESGLDSLKYRIICGDDTSNVITEYIFIYKTVSREYWACPGTGTGTGTGTITMDLVTFSAPHPAVSYNWYNENNVALTNPANPSNSKNVVKDTTDVQIFLVEATLNIPGIGTTTFPRDTLFLYKGTICGDIAAADTADLGCIETGIQALTLNFGPSVVFSTEYEGPLSQGNWNSSNSNFFRASGVSSSSWNGNGNAPGGSTGLCGSATGHSGTGVIGGITRRASRTNYAFMAPITIGGSGNLCTNGGSAGDKIAFTISLSSAHNSGNSITFNNFLITLQSNTTHSAEIYYSFKTGRIPNVCAFQTFGFVVDVPTDNFVIAVTNLYDTVGNPSDDRVGFYFDIARAYLCENTPVITTPPTDIALDEYVYICNTYQLNIDAVYEDKGMLSGPTKSLWAQWQKCTTGCNNDANWFNVGTPDTFAVGQSTIYPNYNVSSATFIDSGYYRIIAATFPQSFDASNPCRVVSSNIASVRVEHCVYAADDDTTIAACGPVMIDVTANDIIKPTAPCSSISGATLEIITAPIYGLATIENQTTKNIIYTPLNTKFGGVDTIIYCLICDINDPTMVDTGLVIINIDKCIEAIDDTCIAFSSVTLVCDVTANDSVSISAPCGGMSGATVEIITQPLNGTASVSGRNINYTADIGACGWDSLRYELNCSGVKDTAWAFIKIEYSLEDDIVITKVNENILISVFANDDVVAGGTFGISHNTSKGTATFVDEDVWYMPTPWEHGLDSFQYYVKCGGDSIAAWVYIFIYRPQETEYYACPGADVLIGITDQAGVTYTWHPTEISNDTIATGLTREVVKLGDTTQVFWVQAHWTGRFLFDRFPINLYMGLGCGGVIDTGCAVTGTILYKEDFGGNSPSDPACMTTLYNIGGVNYLDSLGLTGYSNIPPCTTACSTCPQGTFYRMKEGTADWFSCNPTYDHTYPTSPTQGYFVVLDFESDTSGTAFGYVVNNLCPNTELFVGMWLKNVTNDASVYTHYHPDVSIIVCDPIDSTKIFARFNTGELPEQSGSNCDWKQYGFIFKTTSETSVKIRIKNNVPSSAGNDLLLDDIEIRICLPPVIVPDTLEICIGVDTVLLGTFYDDIANPMFAADPGAKAIWEKYNTATDNWDIVIQETNITETTITLEYPIISPTTADTGLYRMRVTSTTSSWSSGCVAVSKTVRVMEIKNNITLLNDTAITKVNTSVDIAVLLNDIIISPCDFPITLGVRTNPTKGSTMIEEDTLIRYVPTVFEQGVDSFQYYVKIGTDSVTAWVYLFIYKPQATDYYACEGSDIIIAITPQSLVEYRWYETEISTTIIQTSPPDPYTRIVQKNSDPAQAYWVEAYWNNRILFGRFPIYVNMGEGCGGSELTGCFVEGTLLFKEDFDTRWGYGNLPDPIRPTPFTQTGTQGQITANCGNSSNHYLTRLHCTDARDPNGNVVGGRIVTLPYNAAPLSGSYQIVKYEVNWQPAGADWRLFFDHTFKNDSRPAGQGTKLMTQPPPAWATQVRGYFAILDPSEALALQFGDTMYTHTITGLCPGVPLSFSVALANINMNPYNPSAPTPPGPSYEPNVTMRIVDPATSEVLAVYATGRIPYDNTDWGLYGFVFTPTTPSIKFVLNNLTVHDQGNDLAMDDIEIRVCLPPVNVPNTFDFCVGVTSTLSGQFVDNPASPIFAAVPGAKAIWEKYNTATNSWEIVYSEDNILNTTITLSYVFTPQLSDTGMYRMRVTASLSSWDDPCVAVSPTVYVRPVLNNITLTNDIAITKVNTPVDIDILVNDVIISNCNAPIIAGIRTQPTKGDAIMIEDTIIRYTPTAWQYGIDSIEYYVTVGLDSFTAKAYIFIYSPTALQYYACEGIRIKLEMHNVSPSPYTYNWYDAQTDGTLLQANSDSMFVFKSSATEEIFWVQATVNGIIFPRDDVRLYLGVCDIEAMGCFVDGTIIFKEDFGGNSPSDPHLGSPLPSSITTYNYWDGVQGVNALGESEYALIKVTNFRQPAGNPWYHLTDHTYPGDSTRGYLFAANVSATPGKMYETRIDGLCADAELTFSAWLVSMMGSSGWAHRTNLTFEVADTLGNVYYAYGTGDLPEPDPTWRLYGFKFVAPASSLILKIINNSTGSTGADFALDDIEIRICLPPIDLDRDRVVCLDAPFALTATYIDDGNLGGSGKQIITDWQYSADGISWSNLPGTADTFAVAVQTIIGNYTNDSSTLASVGYYRMRVANATTDINSSLCVAISDPCYLAVKTCGYNTAVRNGRWADPETWFNNAPPEFDETVIIPAPYIVYTGSTSKSFGGRAYGRGASSAMGVQGTDWEVGPNEDELNLNATNDTARLARMVIIEDGGTLILGAGHISDNNAMTNTAGRNNPNVVFSFGTITNNSGTDIEIGEITNVTNDTPNSFVWTTSTDWANVRGLQLMAPDMPEVLVTEGENVNQPSLINNGYVYIQGAKLTALGDLHNAVLPPHYINDSCIIDMYGSCYLTVKGDILNSVGDSTRGDIRYSGTIQTTNVYNAYGIHSIGSFSWNNVNSANFTIDSNFINGFGESSKAFTDIHGSTATPTIFTVGNNFINGAEVSVTSATGNTSLLGAGILIVAKDFVNGYANSTGNLTANSSSGDEPFIEVKEWFRNAPGAGSSGTVVIYGGVMNVATSTTETRAKFLNGSHGNDGDPGFTAYTTPAGTATAQIRGGELNIYRSLYNGLVPATNTNNNTNIVAPVKFELESGVVKVYESVKSYNRTASTPAISFEIIYDGKFIMTGTPEHGRDSLVVQRRIEVFEGGQFIIDTNRFVAMSGATLAQTNSNAVSGGLVLNSNTSNVADYNTLESLSNITANDVTGNFAMLRGSTLYIHRGGTTEILGLVNNNTSRNNVYFHRGSYTDATNKASVVAHNHAHIMPTIATNPYGRVEIFLGADLAYFNYFANGDEICLGGKSDSALMIAGAQGSIFGNTANNTCTTPTFYTPLVFVDADANLTFHNNYTAGPNGYPPAVSNGSWHGIAMGKVERRTSIFGPATTTNKDYVFTNRRTYINFSVADATLPSFALTTRWSHPGTGSTVPCASYNPPEQVIFPTDSSKRGQRYYLAEFDIASGGVPIIKDLALAYIGQAEVDSALHDKRTTMLFGAGYSSSMQPMLLANVDTASNTIGSPTGYTHYRYLAENANITLKNTGADPTLGVLESGNEIILYIPSIFTTVRPGRWSDPAVWATGIVPSEEDSVIIRHIIYTGLWAGPGNADGSIVPPTNLLFGARPYGRAESEINTFTIAGIKEAWLSGKLKIIEPDSWAPEGEVPLPPGPSALLICNYLQPPVVAPASNTNYFTQCDSMDWDVVLVFSEEHTDLDNPKAIEVQAGGTSDEMTMTFTDFLTMAKSITYPTSSYYNLNLKGLYIIVNDPFTAPIIRTLGIENKGLIQNDGIIEIGK